jgi:hypothetical protein
MKKAMVRGGELASVGRRCWAIQGDVGEGVKVQWWRVGRTEAKAVRKMGI